MIYILLSFLIIAFLYYFSYKLCAIAKDADEQAEKERKNDEANRRTER